ADNYRHAGTSLEYHLSPRPAVDSSGRLAHAYGSALGTAGAAPYRREIWLGDRPGRRCLLGPVEAADQPGAGDRASPGRFNVASSTRGWFFRLPPRSPR